MLAGLLWFDGDPNRSLEAKIENAARHYRRRMGELPDTCCVNQAILAGRELTLTIDGQALHIMSLPSILANHFWLGKG